ncbi:MAG: hypothetical protein NZM06_08265 [Chloroherpetonaceae bacterium]|nr:hypothetical protein [Chloroherpetonaceae bacterium]MDW8438244.1 hypothetical protein [Chloroherpetonaceae bacterium]
MSITKIIATERLRLARVILEKAKEAEPRNRLAALFGYLLA